MTASFLQWIYFGFFLNCFTITFILVLLFLPPRPQLLLIVAVIFFLLCLLEFRDREKCTCLINSFKNATLYLPSEFFNPSLSHTEFLVVLRIVILYCSSQKFKILVSLVTLTFEYLKPGAKLFNIFPFIWKNVHNYMKWDKL